AYGVYAATRELSLDVPGDVAVCGYDNHPMSALLTPPLTTVDWDIDGIVHSAVRLVVDVIDGKPRRRRVVREPSLRVRASTAGPGAAPGPVGGHGVGRRAGRLGGEARVLLDAPRQHRAAERRRRREAADVGQARVRHVLQDHDPRGRLRRALERVQAGERRL